MALFGERLLGMLGVKAKYLRTYLKDLTGGMALHDGYLTLEVKHFTSRKKFSCFLQVPCAHKLASQFELL